MKKSRIAVLLAMTSILIACNKVTIETNPPATIEDIIAGTEGSAKYMEFEQERFFSARQDEETRAVLYFVKDNCGDCKDLGEEIAEGIDQIPPDVQIFLIDMDSELEITDEYGVKEANTVLQVNHNNQVYGKWTGQDLDHFLEELRD